MALTLESLGGGLFGFDISSMSGVIATKAYTNYFHINGQYRQGGVTGSMPAGSFVGTLVASFIGNKISRKRAIQTSALIWILGSMYVYTEASLHSSNPVQASRPRPTV